MSEELTAEQQQWLQEQYNRIKPTMDELRRVSYGRTAERERQRTQEPLAPEHTIKPA